jgi:hypothetical protein
MLVILIRNLKKYQPITGIAEFFLQLTSIYSRVDFRIYYYGLAFSSLRSMPEDCIQPGQESSQLWDKLFGKLLDTALDIGYLQKAASDIQ